MASPDVIELSDANFEAEVMKSTTPVLVDFWAPWCGPCKAIGPTVDTLATELKGKLRVGKMNVDDHTGVPQRYGIMSIPTLLVFKGGNVVDQFGAMSKAKMEEKLKKHL
jgi:thioredoxin 1